MRSPGSMAAGVFVSAAAILVLLGTPAGTSAAPPHSLPGVNIDGHSTETIPTPGHPAGAVPRRLVEVATCVVGETESEQSVEVGEYTLQAAFECGGTGFPQLAPVCAVGEKIKTCCGEKACSTTPTIASQLKTTDGELENNDGTFTVTLSSMPKDRQQKLLYVCKELDPPAHKCVVNVTLPKEPETSRSELPVVHLFVRKIPLSSQAAATFAGFFLLSCSVQMLVRLTRR